MHDSLRLLRAVENAWADVPPPRLELGFIERWTREQSEAFVTVAPMDVDLDSPGFLAAEPLLDLSPSAAAAYLGTFLRATLRSLHEQDVVGFFDDPLTRAHLITCLEDPGFWSSVVGPHPSGSRLQVLLEVVEHMAERPRELALDAADVTALRACVSAIVGS